MIASTMKHLLRRTGIAVGLLCAVLAARKFVLASSVKPAHNGSFASDVMIDVKSSHQDQGWIFAGLAAVAIGFAAFPATSSALPPRAPSH